MSDVPLPGLESSPEASGEAQSAAEAPEGVRVLRQPGWAILGPSDGLWHRPAARRYSGLIVAVCGREGRYVPDNAHEIILCAACDAQAQPM